MATRHSTPASVPVQPASVLPQGNGSPVQAHGGLVHVAVTCTGISPLLMNALSEQQLLNIRDKIKAPKTAAKPTLRDEAASKLHILQDGRACLPTNAFFKTLINAGQFVRLDGKRQVSTAKSTILTGMLALEDTILPLLKPGTDEPAAWEVDLQQGKNPNGGEAVAIVRPRFDQWEVRATVEIDQQLMPLSMGRELFEIAGKRIGFLEFSPRCRGTFGRWAVTHWEPLTKS